MQANPQAARPTWIGPYTQSTPPAARANQAPCTTRPAPRPVVGAAGSRRWLPELLTTLALLLCAIQAHAATLTVTSNADSGPGSLRQVIADAAAGDTITFDMGQVTSPITLGGAELVINRDLTIQGPGADKLTISGNEASRVFQVKSGLVVIDGLTVTKGKATGTGVSLHPGGGILILPGALLTVSNCVLTSNSASGSGGGISNGQGTLTLRNSTLSGNSAGAAGAGSGGGIYNYSGTVTVLNSILIGNSAVAGGGGVYNYSGAVTLSNSTLTGNSAGRDGGAIEILQGTVTLSNSTLSGNSAGWYGGGVYSADTMTLSNSTLTGNSAGRFGGGVYSLGLGTLTAKNTLLVGNTADTTDSSPNLHGPLDAGSVNNLTELPHDIGIEDILLPLADNGGPTPTHALAPGSPAIDAGDNAAAAGLAFDQRGHGFPRQLGAKVDIGAVEGGPCRAPITVTSNADSGSGSLREALADICPGGTITFAPELEGETIMLTEGELVIDRNVTILGPGAGNLAISGNEASRVFHVTTGIVVINGLTVTKGKVTDTDTEYPLNNGGGILLRPGATLTVSDCILTSNSASSGGGICILEGTLTLRNTTLSGNSADNKGGGVCNNVGAMTLSNSTLSGNSAGYDGGGVYNVSGTVTLSNSTLSGNSAGLTGGGVFNVFGTVTLSNSTLSYNSAGDCCGGVYSSQTLTAINTLLIGNRAPGLPELSGPLAPGSGGNLTELPHDIGIEDILLPLADNGGPTLTHALAPNSPAVDAGDDTAAAGLEFDQRGEGFPRKVGTKVDIGAFEVQLDNTAPSFAACSMAAIYDCVPATGKSVHLEVQVSDPDTQALTVTLLNDGTPIDTRNLSAPANGQIVAFDVVLTPGTHELWVSVSDGQASAICPAASMQMNADTAPIVTSCPGDAVIECPATPGFGTPEFADTCDTSLAITSEDEELEVTGKELSKTRRTWTATDDSGLSIACSQTITVSDTTAPTLTCSGNLDFNATGPDGAVVTYVAATAHDTCGTVTLAYSQESGTLFPVGITTVTVTATDAVGNASTCTFTVRVRSLAEPIITSLIAKVNALPNVKSPNKQALNSKLQAALAALAAGNTVGACQAMQDFINLVKAQADKKLISVAAAADLTADAVRIRAAIGCP